MARIPVGATSGSGGGGATDPPDPYGQFIQQGSWDIAAGAVKPHVNFIGTEFVDDGLRGVINQPVEGMTIYNPSDGNLNIYNGSSWILPDGTTT